MNRKIKRLIFVMGCILLLYTAVIAAGIWQYGKIDEKCQADAVIVLGAGASDDEVSPVFRERLNHAIWLYQNGYVSTLILTGGVGDGNEKSDACVAKQYVIENGVLADDILIEEESTITQENLENAQKIMEQEALETAIIVSDPLHMKRAMLMAEDYGIEAYSSPTPTTKYISMRTKLPFLVREVFFYIGYRVYRVGHYLQVF